MDDWQPVAADDWQPVGSQPSGPASGDVPVRSTASLFFQNLPQFAKNVATGFLPALKNTITYPGDVYSGAKPENTADTLNLATLAMPLAEVGGMPTVARAARAPTEAELEASKTARYNSPDLTNLRFQPEAGPDVANLIRTDLKAAKLDKFNGQKFYDIADRLEQPRFGDNLTLDDFDAARQDASVAPSQADKNDKIGSNVVRNAIDNYLGNIPEGHVLSGNADVANDTLLKARADTAALKRSQEVTEALQRAENRNQSVHSQGNLENITKQQLRPILDTKTGVSKVPGFEDYTPEELSALYRAMNPGFLEKQAGNIGRNLASGGGLGETGVGVLGTGLSHWLGADPITSMMLGMGTAGIGRGLGKVAGRMAQARGDYLGELLRSRSALGDEMFAAGPQRQPISPLFLRAPFNGLNLNNPGQGILGSAAL